MRTLTRTTCSLLTWIAVVGGAGIAAAQQPPPAYPVYPGANPTVPSPYPEGLDPQSGDPAAQYPNNDPQYGDPQNLDDQGDAYDDQDQDDVDPDAYQDFDDALAPYGTWQSVDGYGEVWVPSVDVVGYDFSPYATNGHWVLTEYGWTWVSDWDWGWAPFHYGRWMPIDGYGWGWCPGRVWGPAWVTWRAGGGYVGWAPLPPRTHVGTPPAVHVGWHAVVASEMMSTRPHFVARTALGAVLASTRTFDTWRMAGKTRINVGPHPSLMASLTGRTITAAPLRTVAASAMPRATFASRPLPAPSLTTNRTFQPRALPPMLSHPMPVPTPYRPLPTYRPPVYRTAPTFRPAPTWNAPRPLWTASRPTWSAPRPTWSAPRPMAYTTPRPTTWAATPRWSAPAYSAPRYSAPSYSAPHFSAPSFHAPSFHSAPSFSAPHYSAPSHFGGGFAGGGRRR